MGLAQRIPPDYKLFRDIPPEGTHVSGGGLADVRFAANGIVILNQQLLNRK